VAVGVAIAAALAVVPVKTWLNELVQGDVGFIPALAAIVAVAWLGGFLPGIVATVVGLVAEATLFVDPLGPATLAEVRVRFVLFSLIGVLASWLAWLRTRAEDEARTATAAAAAALAQADLLALRLGALEALAEALAGAATTGQIVDLVVDEATDVLGADEGGIYLLEPGGQFLELAAWRGYEASRAGLRQLSVASPMAAPEVVRAGAPIFIQDPAEYAARYGSFLEERGIPVVPRSLAMVPLETEGERIGAAGFTWNGPQDFPPDRQAFVGALARLAATAIDRSRLFDAVRGRALELEAVIAAIGEAILVADPDGRIRLANASAARLFDRPGSVAALLESLLGAGEVPPSALPSAPTEFRLARRPSSWVEVASYAVDGPLGTASVRVIVGRDVSAFRQGQALREAFLGLLSHELRTPVTTIYGGASLLARPDGAVDQGLRAEILADIAGEADRLYRLIEDLLVLARFDEGIDLGAEPILLQRLVPTVIQQERGRWPAVTLHVDVGDALPAASGDETSIAQVVRNLVSNAAKYSAPGDDVRAEVRPATGGVEVRVLDRGPGIAAREAEAVFEPFYRSDSTAAKAGGAGIGLYVSRRLVEAMGGRVWFTPRPGGGSEFAFLLPLYGGDGEDRAESAATTASDAPRH
jgi:signal transduction histidine kinase